MLFVPNPQNTRKEVPVQLTRFKIFVMVLFGTKLMLEMVTLERKAEVSGNSSPFLGAFIFLQDSVVSNLHIGKIKYKMGLPPLLWGTT